MKKDNSESKRLAASGAFDFLVTEQHPVLKPSEVANAIGWKPDSVRNLIEAGRLEAFADSAFGTRLSYRITRRSVLLYLAETAQFDPADFPRRVNALLAFLPRDQLAATAAEVAKLMQKP